MSDQIEVVSRRTGKKLTVPRKRFDRHPDLFKLAPSARKRQAEKKKPAETPNKPKPAEPSAVADTTDKEAADGAQTEPRTH